MSLVYDKAKQSLLTQTPALLPGSDALTVSIGRVSAYTVNGATDQFKSSCTTVQDASVTLAGVSATSGVFDGTDSTFLAVTAGAALNFIVIWKNTGTGSTSPLLCYFDGFSVTPNGGDITAQWDNGTNRIFKL